MLTLLSGWQEPHNTRRCKNNKCLRKIDLAWRNRYSHTHATALYGNYSRFSSFALLSTLV